MPPIHFLGGGLAGCEAAWQIADAGLAAVLHEMRPLRPTAAHQTDRLAELVCSNSLKSEQEASAPWLLKQELRRLGSLVLRAAETAHVPGGHALTVDRDIFSQEVTRAITSHPRIELRREEVREIPAGGFNLALIMQKLVGVGKPRRLQGLSLQLLTLLARLFSWLWVASRRSWQERKNFASQSRSKSPTPPPRAGIYRVIRLQLAA